MDEEFGGPEESWTRRDTKQPTMVQHHAHIPGIEEPCMGGRTRKRSSKKDKRLEKAACGEDAAKKAALDLRWMRAEAEVKSMLLMTVDESHRLDIEALPCKDAWKALQPANQANVLLRMVTDLLRERLTDHKSVAKYITKVRTAMTQLFSDDDAKA